jgi:predicted ATP-dependent endonuclease of OLD family
MNILISKIKNKCELKQIFATTHSAYILNKLGIEKVILIGKRSTAFLKNLPLDTQNYFKKLSGYDTLRLILAKKTILVEGPSDELIIQKAYLMKHNKLPLEDGIDIISVRGLSFSRFLDIAKELKNSVAVVTDNDGDYNKKIVEKYKNYTSEKNIKIYASNNDSLTTLEPHIISCNSLALLNKIFKTKHADIASLEAYMKNNKTECAINLFDTSESIQFPQYVQDAIA